MPRRRRKLVPDDVGDLFASTVPSRRSTPYDQEYERHTYRVTDMTHDKLKAIAEQYGIGLNDLVRWVFRRFVYGVEQGEIVIPVEEYVVTRSRLAD